MSEQLQNFKIARNGGETYTPNPQIHDRSLSWHFTGTVHVREYRKCNHNLDNPEKLAISGIQDEDKQNKNTTQYVLDTTIRYQAQITLIIPEPFYKQ
jgi:hypothetical protein